MPTLLNNFLGSWNPKTNVPSLVDGTGTTGNFYIILPQTYGSTIPPAGVSPEYTRNLGSGNKAWLVNSYIYYDGAIWKSTTTDQEDQGCCDLESTTTVGNDTDRGIVLNNALGNALQFTNGVGTTSVVATMTTSGNTATIQNASGIIAYLSDIISGTTGTLQQVTVAGNTTDRNVIFDYTTSLTDDHVTVTNTQISTKIYAGSLIVGNDTATTFGEVSLNAAGGSGGEGEISFGNFGDSTGYYASGFLRSQNKTALRTWLLPDKTGVIALLSDISSGGTGTVTSVALTVPSAFSISGSPITTSGTLAIMGAGSIAQYIRGDGTLSTFPSLIGYVPYSGATSNVTLGIRSITASNLSGTNTGDQTITLTGDVTGSGTGSFAATITNNAVTYAKIQTLSAISRLLGSSSTTTAVQEILLAPGLTMSGNTLILVTSGVNSIASSDASLVVTPTTGAVDVSMNMAHSNAFSVPQSISGNTIANTTVAGLTLVNNTAATAGNPKWSPAFVQQGTSWNTGAGGSSNAMGYSTGVETASISGVSGNYVIKVFFGTNPSTGTTLFSMNSLGLTLSGGISTGLGTFTGVTMNGTLAMALGKKITIATGTNATAGTVTPISGTVTVSTNQVTAASIIQLTVQDTGTFTGNVRVSARVVGTSFTIIYSILTDTAPIGWILIN